MATIPYRNKAGQRIPGVTTIIGNNLGWSKGGLMHWAWEQGMDGKDYRTTRDDAADAGTVAHRMVECWILGTPFAPDGIPPATIALAEMAFGGFLTWARHSRLEVVETEMHLVSERYQYGATPDAIALVDGELSLPDWKSGKGVYGDMMIQLAAYRNAYEEVTGKTLRGGCHICRFDKESGGFNHLWRPREALDGAWEVFLHLRAIHDAKKAIEALAK